MKWISIFFAVAAAIQVEDIVRFNPPLGPGRLAPCDPGPLCTYLPSGDLISIAEDGSTTVLANFASLIDPGSFTLGYITDKDRENHYVVNGGANGQSGCPTGCVIRVPQDTLVPEIFTQLNLGGVFNFYSGVDIVKGQGNSGDWLLVASEITGGVTAVNLETGATTPQTDFLIQGQGDFAFLNSTTPNPDAQVENLNLFGIPLGANGIACYKDELCWIAVLNERRIVEADVDRSTGLLSNYRVLLPEVVDGAEPRAGGFSYEGLYWDKFSKKLLASAVFEDFDDVRNTKPANAIFMIDPFAKSVRRIDGPFGMSAQVLPGHLFSDRYNWIVSVTGFESSNFWPCGNLAQGGDLPCSPDFYTTPDFFNAAVVGVCENSCE